MADFEIRGADDVADLVRAIRKHADAKALRKELYSGLNRVTKDIRGELIEVIPAALPRRGGLAELIQGSTTSRTTAKAGKWAGVSMRFQSRGHDVRTLVGKRLRHPVWGNRSRWVEQTKGVDPAVFTAKFDEQRPDVQREILRVLNEVARKVERSI
jgi:hypothetical protein